MRKLLFIAVILLSVVTLAQAQRGSGQRPSQTTSGKHQQMDPEQRIQSQIDRLSEAVSLTDAQKIKVKAIFKSGEEKQSELFQSMKASGTQVTDAQRKQMREKRDEMTKKQDAEIKAILTSEQAAKYETYLKARAEKMKERMNNGGSQRGNR